MHITETLPSVLIIRIIARICPFTNIKLYVTINSVAIQYIHELLTINIDSSITFTAVIVTVSCISGEAFSVYRT